MQKLGREPTFIESRVMNIWSSVMAETCSLYCIREECKTHEAKQNYSTPEEKQIHDFDAYP